MADVSVKQLADTVGTPVDRLLRQMGEAGLPHKTDEELVTEDQKKTLLAFLQKSHGGAEEAPRKITLKRKSTGTLKAGQGRSGRSVTVEVRRDGRLADAANSFLVLASPTPFGSAVFALPGKRDPQPVLKLSDASMLIAQLRFVETQDLQQMRLCQLRMSIQHMHRGKFLTRPIR